MNQRDEFERMLDSDPHDWDTRKLYADWLDERGKEVAANGQRWQAVENRIPYRVPDGHGAFEGDSYYWNLDDIHPLRAYTCHSLPLLIWDLSVRKRHTTRQAAELALAERLNELRIVAGTKQAVLDDEVVRENEFAPLDAMRVRIVEKE